MQFFRISQNKCDISHVSQKQQPSLSTFLFVFTVEILEIGQKVSQGSRVPENQDIVHSF